MLGGWNAELGNSESKYRTLVENLDEILVRVEIEQGRDRLIFEGPQVKRTLGYELEEFTKDPNLWFRLVHPNDLAAMRRQHEDLLGGGKPAIEQFRLRHKKGHYVWLEARRIAALDESGRILGLQMLLRDITERHAAEEARRVSEERYQSLFEDVPDIVFTADLWGRFTSINSSAGQILGYSREELLGIDVSHLFAGRDRLTARDWFRASLAGDKAPVSNTVIMKTKSGGMVTLELNTRLRYQAGLAVELVGMARDVSDRLRLLEELHQAQKMESIGRLASGVAHDFNNLLTIVMGHSQLLLADLIAQDPNRSHAEAIQAAARRAANVTRQLLAFSRKTSLQPELVDLGGVVSNIVPMLQRLIGEDITLAVEFPPDLNSVKAVPTQIEQIIMNLAVNARDAMPHHGRITLRTASLIIDQENEQQHPEIPTGGYIVLSIADTGTGMDEETKKHLFEPFFTTKEIGKGTGLGLATVYEMTKQNNGYVEFSSECGRGTEFRIYLPYARSARQEKDSPDLRMPPTNRVGTVLVVEDEDAVRGVVSHLLKKNGYRVIEANSGDVALPILEQRHRRIDLLLTDIIMPGIDGSELATRARSIRPKLKVLYMSGYTRDIVDDLRLASSGDAVMMKPFSEKDLLEHLQSAVCG